MKNALIIVLFLTIRFASGQTTKLNLASDVWPPFTDVPGKHAFALDLVREALARVNVEANTEILDFQEVIQAINTKKFDGSAALWYSKERSENLLFSEPYLENRLILVGKKGANVNAKNMSELKGKRIATVESYAYGPLLDKANNSVLVKGKNDQENLERLLKGEADYLLADALLIEYLLKYQNEEATKFLEIGTTSLVRLPLYFAIRKEIPDAQKIIENFNLQITQMVAEGTYNKILQLNWVSTDVDGDGQPELVLSGDKAGTNAPSNSYAVKAQADGSSGKSQRFMIEGKVYSSWDEVPKKYKVPENTISNSDKVGFGPVFKF